MNALFLILFTLLLIVMQTVIFPSFSWFSQCFDLLIIDVLFLSLISSHYSMVLVIIFIGCVMDSISGVPFCYHIFSYLWIYIIVQIVRQLLFQESIVFVIIISVVSVLIQQGLLIFSIFINQGDNATLNLNVSLLLSQVFWGFIIIPPSIWLVTVCKKNWNLVSNFLMNYLFKNTEGDVDRIH
ncbi:MAG: hypothetical protein GY699_13485 [Desulfobacteraceae bacterium]|nr:hypothetical protein [Desulfobacteraceae bacterium]